MGFFRAVAHALPVCFWTQWGNKQTSTVYSGRESSKQSLFLCRKARSRPVLLSSGLELTNSVASFVVAVISVCVLNSKGKFDLNQPWSHIIKANEQVPICIKVNNSIIQKKIFANESLCICPARDEIANLNKTSQNMCASTLSGTRMGADTIWNHRCSHSQKRQKDAVKQERCTRKPWEGLQAAVWRWFLSFSTLRPTLCPLLSVPHMPCSRSQAPVAGWMHVTSMLAGGDSAPQA